jgi:hypothetical protein
VTDNTSADLSPGKVWHTSRFGGERGFCGQTMCIILTGLNLNQQLDQNNVPLVASRHAFRLLLRTGSAN